MRSDLRQFAREDLPLQAQQFPAWVERQPRLLVAAIVGLVYAAAVAASLLLASLALDVSTVWLPAGIGLVAVMICGFWLLPLIAIVHIVVSFAVGDLSLLARVGLGLIATSEIGLAGWMLRRFGTGRSVTFDLRGTARFAVICLLLVPITGALAATLWLNWVEVLGREDMLIFARNWWLAVALGIICITPLVNSWLLGGTPKFHGPFRGAMAVLVVLAAPSTLMLSYQIQQHDPVEGVLFACLPIMLWASIFLRETGAATALTLSTLLVVGTNYLLPEQSLPVWITATHILAFGLTAMLIANAQTSLEEVASERARQAELQELAFRDTLTGLGNRNRLLMVLDEAMSQWRQDGSGFAVVMMDLDDFKPVNDTHGHHAGDEVLRIIGARLQNCSKRGDLVARFGGDEFVAVLRHCPSAEIAKAAAERIMGTIFQPISIQISERESVTVRLGASIGVAHIEDGPARVETLMKQADLALYKAKHSGKSKVAVFSSSEKAV